MKKELKNTVKYKTFSLGFDGFISANEKALKGASIVKIWEDASHDAEQEKGNVFRFIGTSEAVDRDGEIVLLDGWQLDNYITNPVVLWGHEGRALPIGKTVGLYKDEKKRALYFDIAFTDSHDLARTVKALVSEGILKATSVGFRVLDWDYDEKAEVFLLTKNELFEISIVTVPANQDALIQHEQEVEHQKSIDDAAMAAVMSTLAEIQQRLGEVGAKVDALSSEKDDEVPPAPAGEGENEEEEIPPTEPKTEAEIEPATPVLSEEVLNTLVTAVLDRLNQEVQPTDPKVEEPIEPSPGSGDSDVAPKEEPELTPDQDPEIVVVPLDELDDSEEFIIVN